MEKVSEITRLLGFCLAFLLLASVLCFGLGCQRTLSSQDAPVTTQQATVGQPNIFQIQFMTAQSKNARPIHAKAAEALVDGTPTGLGRNWAEFADFRGATIYFSITVGSESDTAAEAVGTPTTGPVQQSPTQENTAAIPVAVGANPTANATAGDGATGGTTTGGGNQPAPTPPTPAPAPAAPDPTSTPELPTDPSGDAGDDDDDRMVNVMSLRQREQIMLAKLKASQRQ